MDILKAEIARKRKLLEEKKLVDENKKYFKRGDLIEEEKKEYIKKYLATETQHNDPQSASFTGSFEYPMSSKDPTLELMNLPRSEVIRKLRERGVPILLFGESEVDSCHRLRQLEISAPEVNRGFRNDFQEAMEEVDQAYLQEILSDNPVDPTKDKNKNEDIDVDESVTYESIQREAERLGRGNKEHDINVIITLLKFLLKQWNDQLNSVASEERMKTKTKIAKATFTQTRVYLKPLLKKLKNDKIPDDIFDSLTEIVKHILKRDYIAASDAYLTMAIGNAPWWVLIKFYSFLIFSY